MINKYRDHTTYVSSYGGDDGEDVGTKYEILCI